MMKPDFTRRLLQWNKDSNTRAMPWKGEKDPYKIWLSEIILQQTRVEQGWSYYEKFIAAFPTILHLAKANEEKVFKMWEGLGYYSRCKNLIATARKIASEYNGIFPATYDEIEALPGIGPYTASAISSFAFNLPHAVVDGNVQRILARYFGITTPIDTTAGKKQFQSLAQSLLPNNEPGTYNQAIMDFGATICKPQNPLCSTCVQQKGCEAFKQNRVGQLPIKQKTLIRKERWLYYFIIEHKNKWYIKQRTGKDIWENLFEFVLYESPAAVEEITLKMPFLKKLVNGQKDVQIESISKMYRQQLTHQTIHGRFVKIKIPEPLPGLSNFLLINKKELSKYAFPRFITTFLGEPAPPAQLF
jgi:A/G-specific adenine glycosylase